MKHSIDQARTQGILDLSTMPLVMVSATPFWPVQFIELLQRRKIVKGGSSPEADLEFWRNNLRAHTDFLLEIMKSYNPASIVFLRRRALQLHRPHCALCRSGRPPDRHRQETQDRREVRRHLPAHL